MTKVLGCADIKPFHESRVKVAMAIGNDSFRGLQAL